jgi:hypothetical protein
MSTTTVEQTTKVVTGRVRLSYCHLFEPASVNDGEDKKYSVAILIPKDDKETLDKIRAGIEAAKQAGKSKWDGVIPKKGLKEPLRDGDEEKEGDEAYEGHFFLNATSKSKPCIVSTTKGTDGKFKEITDPEEVYSGCYGRASINFYAFNQKGNKGIAVGLNNIQKLADGEPLGGGRTKPEDDFDDFTGDDDLL